MNLLTVYFEQPEGSIYRDLRRIYENSLQQAMPNVESIIVEPKAPDRKRYNHKLDTATGFIAAANWVLHNPDFYAVADIDVMWWRSIEDLPDLMKNYDIMITTRNLKRKWSSGLWAMNPTDAGTRFVKRWRDAVAETAHRFDEEAIKRAVQPWGGIDHYAFNLVHEELKSETRILYLPCCEWNAEVSCWHKMSASVRMVHIYSKLRKVFAGTVENDDPLIGRLAKRARGYLT